MTHPHELDGDLAEHLVTNRLAGQVATTPRETRRNCERLVSGHVDYTFGLSDWRSADVAEARSAVVALCGDRALADPPDGPGHIDPVATVRAIERHRQRLADHARSGSRVLIATGHPTGLLGHYLRIADALVDRGCELLTPMDDRWLLESDDRRSGIRFVRGVGCVWNGGALLHTHRSVYMESLLDACADDGRPPDLVVGDHGMAGAAVERGIETLSIADVNDPALPLARLRGRTDAVLPIDDNLAPRLFEPVSSAMLAGVA